MISTQLIITQVQSKRSYRKCSPSLYVSLRRAARFLCNDQRAAAACRAPARHAPPSLPQVPLLHVLGRLLRLGHAERHAILDETRHLAPEGDVGHGLDAIQAELVFADADADAEIETGDEHHKKDKRPAPGACNAVGRAGVPRFEEDGVVAHARLDNLL